MSSLRIISALFALACGFSRAPQVFAQGSPVACGGYFAESAPLGGSNLVTSIYEAERARFAAMAPAERGTTLADRLNESGRTSGRARAETLLGYLDSFVAEGERLDGVVAVTLGRVRFGERMISLARLTGGWLTNWNVKISGSDIWLPSARVPSEAVAVRMAWSFAVSIREMAFSFKFIPRNHGRHSAPVCSRTRLCAENNPSVALAEAAEGVGSEPRPSLGARVSSALRLQLPGRFAESVLTDLELIEDRLYRLRQALIESSPSSELPSLETAERNSTVAMSEAIPTLAVAGIAGSISYYASGLISQFLTILQPERAAELAAGNSYLGPICFGAVAGAFALSVRYSALRGHCLSAPSFERWREGGPAVGPEAQSALSRRLRGYWVSSNFMRATVLSTVMATAIATPLLIRDAYTYRDHVRILIDQSREWMTDAPWEAFTHRFEDNVLSNARAMQRNLDEQIREMAVDAVRAADPAHQNLLRLRRRMLQDMIDAHGDLR